LGLVCALVIGVYAWRAHSGALELLASGTQDNYYNLLVRGFRDGQLNVKEEVPPGLAHLDDWTWLQNHALLDLSYYKGKLYLYFGVTPALVLFWPYAALTGHYLSHKDAVVFFFSVGFLAGAGLLRAVWRRYFKETGFGALVAGVLALGLGSFAPAMLAWCDVYEVPISCGYALTMLALAGIWAALHDARRSWRWLAGASLAHGLAVGARPSLLFGAVILLVPVAQGWREKRPVWPLLLAATAPIAAIGLGLMVYNTMRFDNPLEFGQRHQLPVVAHRQFSLNYLWFNFRVGFLEPARWGGSFPFVHDIALPARPKGYFNAAHPFGVLTNIPLVWLALAAPLAWRRRSAEARSILRWFFGAVGLLFAMCALTLALHDSMALRYELEFASPLLLLAVMSFLALERETVRQAVWRRAVRCGWILLLAFSAVFSLCLSFETEAALHREFATSLLQTGRVEEAITQYEEALEIKPDQPDTLNNLAWVLVTAPEASLRNGTKAVALAEQANQLSGGGNPTMLRTLALAYAETGSYGLAAATARRGLELAMGQKNDTLAASLQKEIQLYEANTPVRDAPR
jgi:hypothetical protein